ncbi:MAG: hypothetical protein C5B48_10245 [Candidatus Rokuibacteriota bacterium]|nr:MAG: hypothetical protein C5B48_10245 [Candidatus Rokubacteria bacterium]
MKTEYPFGVELRSAALCIELDCSTIFDGTAHRHCPRCGSAICYPLATWLDRAGRHPDATHRDRRVPRSSGAREPTDGAMALARDGGGMAGRSRPFDLA